MDDNNIIEIFSALSNQSRWLVIRLLIKHGDEGLSVGDIGKALSIPPSTLNFHLDDLLEAKLIKQIKTGRIIQTYANIEPLARVLDILRSECCSEMENTNTNNKCQ
jgi:DNA-binding transcriptional ArsR family regulator